jgi:hypothetical protein
MSSSKFVTCTPLYWVKGGVGPFGITQLTVKSVEPSRLTPSKLFAFLIALVICDVAEEPFSRIALSETDLFVPLSVEIKIANTTEPIASITARPTNNSTRVYPFLL